MTDITEFMLRYREAARSVWNCHLRELPADFPHHHDWEAVKQVLFTTLVLRRCGHDDCAAALLSPERYGFSWTDAIVHLKVIPVSNVPIMISRDRDGGPYWDHPVDRLGPNDADLRFIDFFDFDESGYIDFEYYRVRIDSSSRHVSIVGHHALLKVSYAKVLAEPPNASTPPEPG